MPKIRDMVVKPYSTGSKNLAYYLLVDEMPKRVYTRHDGGFLISNDGGFYDFLQEVRGSRDAFGGREFDIAIDDGSTLRCSGQVWHCGHVGHIVDEPTISVGVATQAMLDNCYVFSSANVSVALIDEWLASNKPTAEYYAFDPQRSPYAVLARWQQFFDSGVSGSFKGICAKRARVLRRRGVKIWQRADGARFWCPWFERQYAEALAMHNEVRK